MKVIAILERFAHHNIATSPDNMINYIKYDEIISPNKEEFRNIMLRKIWVAASLFVQKSAGMSGYEISSLVTELKAIYSSFAEKNLIHFFNGDINCKIFPSLKGKNTVITTYHQPPDFFYDFFNKCSHIKRLDAVLVTSNVQKELFSKYVSSDRIFFMPLAVDTDLFKPGTDINKTDKKICLLVGNWLRDFQTMREVIKRLEGHNNIEFHIITLKTNMEHFKGLKNVTFYSGIPLEHYIKELHMADLLVLPLKSCTSNLAVLESMACGLPIVTTDVGGIRDYVNESFSILLKKGDHKAMAESIIGLFDDNKRRKEMSIHAREHAKRFSWDVTYKKLKKIYEHMGATGL